MNNEMYQICSIVAAGKKAIKDNLPIKFTPTKHENSITFTFVKRKFGFIPKKYTAPDISSWYKYLIDKGLEDIKFLCPSDIKDRNLLGYANTTNSCIVCFFKNKAVTYFTSDWQFNSAEQKWNISYTEQKWDSPPSKKPCFENNTDSFRKILIDIQEFALKIGCEYFANKFMDSLNILDGRGKYPDEKYDLDLPQIPKDNLQIFEAASLADVFGAMGSWNDSPPYMAQEKGLNTEYETLSAELLKNIRLAILYSINQW